MLSSWRLVMPRRLIWLSCASVSIVGAARRGDALFQEQEARGFMAKVRTKVEKPLKGSSGMDSMQSSDSFVEAHQDRHPILMSSTADMSRKRRRKQRIEDQMDELYEDLDQGWARVEQELDDLYENYIIAGDDDDGVQEEISKLDEYSAQLERELERVTLDYMEPSRAQPVNASRSADERSRARRGASLWGKALKLVTVVAAMVSARAPLLAGDGVGVQYPHWEVPQVGGDFDVAVGPFADFPSFGSEALGGEMVDLGVVELPGRQRWEPVKETKLFIDQAGDASVQCKLARDVPVVACDGSEACRESAMEDRALARVPGAAPNPARRWPDTLLVRRWDVSTGAQDAEVDAASGVLGGDYHIVRDLTLEALPVYKRAYHIGHDAAWLYSRGGRWRIRRGHEAPSAHSEAETIGWPWSDWVLPPKPAMVSEKHRGRSPHSVSWMIPGAQTLGIAGTATISSPDGALMDLGSPRRGRRLRDMAFQLTFGASHACMAGMFFDGRVWN